MKRIRRVLLALLLLVGGGVLCRSGFLAAELPKMVGKDATQLDAEHHTALLLLTNFGLEIRGEFIPWHVWTYQPNPRETRYILFSGEPLTGIPGQSSASIILLTSSGRKIDSWKFSTGWRIDLESATFAVDQKLGTPIITLSTGASINGRDVARQYFALAGEQLYFVRMENGQGGLLRNNYVAPNHTLGGDPPADDLASWAKLLSSPELPQRLAALVFLSGEHMNPAQPREANLLREPLKMVETVFAFRNADSTKRLIEEYRKSDHPWLKQAADFAAAPP